MFQNFLRIYTYKVFHNNNLYQIKANMCSILLYLIYVILYYIMFIILV